MKHFEDYKNEPHIINYIKEAISRDAFGQSYIFEGVRGNGRQELAELTAAALLCTDRGSDPSPCGKCHSCMLMESGTHPDCIIVKKLKSDKVLSVDDIREQVISDISIKPYYGGRKVYIIPDAEDMNINSANALLKTIEEPPDYAVIILITKSKELLLPTIRSRCMTFSFRAEPRFETNDEELKQVLARVEDFLGDRRQTAGELIRFAKEISVDHKADIPDILEYIEFSCKEALLLRAGANLTENDNPIYIEKMSDISFEGLNRILEEVEKAKRDTRRRVNEEVVLDSLFLNISRIR